MRQRPSAHVGPGLRRPGYARCSGSRTLTSRNQGLIGDPLFVGATRPAMAFGVTYSALLVNALVTVELFLLTRNLLWLAVCVPIHALAWLVCAREPRFFDLALLWGKTRGPGMLGNARRWRANGYAPLVLDMPDARGRRRYPGPSRVVVEAAGWPARVPTWSR